MSNWPVKRELQPLVMSKAHHPRTHGKLWLAIEAAVTNTDLLTVVGFCLLGLFAALNIATHFPDLGATITEYNLF